MKPHCCEWQCGVYFKGQTLHKAHDPTTEHSNSVGRLEIRSRDLLPLGGPALLGWTLNNTVILRVLLGYGMGELSLTRATSWVLQRKAPETELLQLQPQLAAHSK